jgi:hypothetical protein
MPVDETVGQTPVAARRTTVALAALVVLLVAAVVSAVSWVWYAEYLSETMADIVIVAQVLAVLYGVLAGAAFLGGAILVVGRPRLGAWLLLAVLALTVPGQALILFGVVHDYGDVLDGSGRVVGDPSVTLAVVLLTTVAVAALATSTAVVALIRRR